MLSASLRKTEVQLSPASQNVSDRIDVQTEGIRYASERPKGLVVITEAAMPEADYAVPQIVHH